MTGEKTVFTQGSILRKLCLFMLPILGALILQAAYGAVDLLVVGRFGSTSGLSAVPTGCQVLNLVTFVVTQLAMGVTVLIARYLGERCPEQIGAVIGGAAVVFALVSALLFAVLVGLARPIAVVMQAPAEAVTLTASYVRICGGGTFFIVAYNLLSAIFRGLGNSRSPLLFVLVACLVNVADDLPCHRRRQRGLDPPDGAGDRHEDRHRHGPCAGAHPREGRTRAERHAAERPLVRLQH